MCSRNENIENEKQFCQNVCSTSGSVAHTFATQCGAATSVIRAACRISEKTKQKISKKNIEAISTHILLD